MLEYARWKYILVGVVLVLALLFALPNVFGDDARCRSRARTAPRSTRRSTRASRRRSRTSGVAFTSASSTTAA